MEMDFNNLRIVLRGYMIFGDVFVGDLILLVKKIADSAIGRKIKD